MMVAIGNFFFQARNAAFPAACLLVLLPGPPIFVNALHAVLAGFGIAGIGQALRIATIGLRYIIRGGRNRRVYAEDLVTEGLYAHSRNPMYVGNLLILAGVAVASNSWSCVLVATPAFTFIYVAIVAAEENYLRAKFNGAFDRYAQDVPRWMLRLHGLRQTLADSKFHWRRVAVKEYGTTTALIIGICAIGLVNLSRAGQVTSVAFDILIAIAVTSAFAWVVIRILKKSRHLAGD